MYIHTYTEKEKHRERERDRQTNKQTHRNLHRHMQVGMLNSVSYCYFYTTSKPVRAHTAVSARLSESVV